MSLSFVTYTGNGVLAAYSYANIELLDDDFVTHASQLKVYVGNVEQTLNTQYTVTPGSEIITFTGGNIPLNGAFIKIQRFTKSDTRYVNYTNSTNVTATILNTDASQLLFLTQEALDLRDTAIALDPITDSYDAQSKKITNTLPATDSTDVPNLGQVISLLEGAVPGVLGTQGYYTATGDGTIDDFSLPSNVSGLLATDINVFVQGVKQKPLTDYTIASNVITFAVAPTNGHVVMVTWNKGTVPATLVANSLETDNYIDQSVTAPKLTAGGSATTNHVLRVTNSPVVGNVSYGTIVASAISDFDTQVRTNRLDQMTAPSASVSMGSQRITSLANPSNATDAVNRQYLDSRYWQTVYERIQVGARCGVYDCTAPGTPGLIQYYTYSLSQFSTIKHICLSVPITVSNATTFYNLVTFNIPINDSLATPHVQSLIAPTTSAATTGTGVYCSINFPGGNNIDILVGVAVNGQLVNTASATPLTGYRSKDWILQVSGY